MSSTRPKIIAGIAATAALAAYGALLFMVPSILDWAFDEGGKAPMLIAVVGAAVVVGTFLGVEKLVITRMRG